MAIGVSISEKQIIDIANRHIHGHTIGAIAEEVGLSKRAVHNCIHNNVKCKKHMESIIETYRDELLSLAIDELKDSLLDEKLNPYVRPQLLKLAFKYSGAETGASTVKVEADTKVNINEISLDELSKLKFK